MAKVTGFCCLAALVLTGMPVATVTAGWDKSPKFATRKVSHRDLDLSRADHMERLRKRVSSAAYGVCVSDANGRFVGPSARFRIDCHAAVMARVEPQLARLAGQTRQAHRVGRTPMAAESAALTIQSAQ